MVNNTAAGLKTPYAIAIARDRNMARPIMVYPNPAYTYFNIDLSGIEKPTV